MKIKYFIIPLVLSWAILSVGQLFKIQSWPWASQMLTIGTFIETLSYLFLAIKLLLIKDPKSFLNK